MAIVGTIVAQNPNELILDITCADADTTVSIAHNLSQAPQELIITPSVSLASTAYGQFAVTATATNLVITKQNVAGSGGTTPGTTKVARIAARVVASQN